MLANGRLLLFFHTVLGKPLSGALILRGIHKDARIYALKLDKHFVSLAAKASTSSLEPPMAAAAVM
jgi:hypothetical protein